MSVETETPAELIERYVSIFTLYRKKPVKVTYSQGKFKIEPHGLTIDRKTLIRYTENLNKWFVE